MKKTSCPINRLGEEVGHFFFGYYEKCPWDTAQKRLLAHHVGFCDRFPDVSDTATIGYFDLDKDREFIPLTETTAWNWQQGAQLQWIMVQGREQVLFNRRFEDGVRACLLDPASGHIHPLRSSVYAVSRDGTTGLSLNYGRLFNLRPDYGLSGEDDPFEHQPVPRKDGIYRFDLPDGKPELILSIADVEAVERNPMGESRKHWVNHLMFNPSGSRFCFLHRFERKDGIVHSRLMSANCDGSELRLLFEGMVSHYDWLDDQRIFAWAGRRSLLAGGGGGKKGLGTILRKGLKPIYYALGKPRILMQRIVGDAYHIIDDAKEKDSQEVAKGVLTSDGHCTVSPDGKWILTDGYTDSKNRLPLFLWSLEREEAVEIGRFPTPPELDGPLRVDLHPRFSRDGRQVCIDSAMSGVRNMYIVEIDDVLRSVE